MTILILGGTSEARRLAGLLAEPGAAHSQGVGGRAGSRLTLPDQAAQAAQAAPGSRVVSSLAGRVADPALPAGEVRIGGFGGVAGLVSWLREHEVAAVVDATHPFAQNISAHAAAACDQSGTPLLSLVRAPWTTRPGDRWHEVDSLAAAARLLPALGRRAFLTTGRQGLGAFAGLDELWFLVRCVDPPADPLPAACQVILARGPYDASAEQELMREHRIDVLVTKNSGGDLTAGKLAAARELGLPVVMVGRPALPDVPRCSSVEEAAHWVTEHWGTERWVTEGY